MILELQLKEDPKYLLERGDVIKSPLSFKDFDER